jgi:uncharacterized protein YbjT (DUF2867 family)
MTRVVRVLVTGATGRQGGAVARALLGRGHRVRVVTRKPTAPPAAQLRELGAEIARGSFDDRGSIERAAAGVDALFAVGTPFESGTEVEIRQGIAVADAAMTAGVELLVYTSVAGADQGTGIPHFESKRVVEEHIASLGIAFIVLRPVYFMENLLSPRAVDRLRHGVHAAPLPADRPLELVAIDDIGRFCAHALERPERLLNRHIELASDELTGAGAAAALSRVGGREIRYAEVPLTQVRAESEDLAAMYRWLRDVGHRVDIPALHAAYPEIAWQPFEAWARLHLSGVLTSAAA